MALTRVLQVTSAARSLSPSPRLPQLFALPFQGTLRHVSSTSSAKTATTSPSSPEFTASDTPAKSIPSTPSKPSTALTPTQHASLLANQRLNRPVSPHLSIYRPQIHSISSALQRNTGLLLSGSLYIFGITYALNSSLLPLLFSSYAPADVTAGTVALAAAVGGMGAGVVGWIGKATVGWTGVFHGINGMLGLARGTSTTFVGERARFVKVGWWVMGASVVGTVGVLSWY